MPHSQSFCHCVLRPLWSVLPSLCPPENFSKKTLLDKSFTSFPNFFNFPFMTWRDCFGNSTFLILFGFLSRDGYNIKHLSFAVVHSKPFLPQLQLDFKLQRFFLASSHDFQRSSAIVVVIFSPSALFQPCRDWKVGTLESWKFDRYSFLPWKTKEQSKNMQR